MNLPLTSTVTSATLCCIQRQRFFMMNFFSAWMEGTFTFYVSWMLRICFFDDFQSLPLCLQPPKSHFLCAHNLPKVTSVEPATSQKSLPLCPQPPKKSLPLSLQPPKSHFLCAHNLPKVTSVVPTTTQKVLKPKRWLLIRYNHRHKSFVIRH
jgi:hypothetical protein